MIRASAADFRRPRQQESALSNKEQVHMDATVESGRAVTGNPDGTTGIPRRYAGQGGAQDRPGPYTTLLPADDEWSRDTVLRAIVADALQRNGLVVDEDTLEATIASFGSSDSALAGGALAGTAPTWKLHPGETRADGRSPRASRPASCRCHALGSRGARRRRRDDP
jgi:hypothetical protein